MHNQQHHFTAVGVVGSSISHDNDNRNADSDNTAHANACDNCHNQIPDWYLSGNL
jgi:hypothetical protein